MNHLYCNYCLREIRYNLINHVRINHKAVYDEMANTTRRVRSDRLRVLNGEMGDRESVYWNPRNI